MTKDEAIEMYIAEAYADKPRTQNQKDAIRAQVASKIQGLAALGLIKLDPPRSPVQLAISAMLADGFTNLHYASADAVGECLARSGLKIVST